MKPVTGNITGYRLTGNRLTTLTTTTTSTTTFDISLTGQLSTTVSEISRT